MNYLACVMNTYGVTSKIIEYAVRSIISHMLHVHLNPLVKNLLEQQCWLLRCSFQSIVVYVCNAETDFIAVGPFYTQLVSATPLTLHRIFKNCSTYRGYQAVTMQSTLSLLSHRNKSPCQQHQGDLWNSSPGKYRWQPPYNSSGLHQDKGTHSQWYRLACHRGYIHG